MPAPLSGSDIINIAIDIERRGVSFYDIMAKSSDDENTRAVFLELLDMEREHIEVFQEMLGEIHGHSFSEAITPEFSDYIQSLVDAAVFSDDMIIGEMASQADTDIRALELGINSEKDSILFYYEIRDIMPARVVPTINRILAEEKKHLRRLTAIMKELEGGYSES
jgi:rubrerythrin